MKKINFIFSLLLLLLLPSCDSSQLDEVELEFEAGPNATVPLEIVNYLGNTQNIHPKVLYFKKGWNGYKFWMAYTPYPMGVTSAENPCIAVSNDGFHWITPEGLTIPLADKFAEGYNSDTHLVYNHEMDMLECWWRPHYEAEVQDVICRRTSKDGINWSEPVEEVYRAPQGTLCLSPAVFIHGGEYYMYYSDKADIFVMRCDVKNQKFDWSKPELVPIDRGELGLWHHDVILNDDGSLEFVICAYEPGFFNNDADLYYVKGDLKSNKFSEPVKILSRPSDSNAIDSRSIYRTSIVKVDKKYYLYYSCIDMKWNRYMALSIGDSVFTLRGTKVASNNN